MREYEDIQFLDHQLVAHNRQVGENANTIVNISIAIIWWHIADTIDTFVITTVLTVSVVSHPGFSMSQPASSHITP